MSIIKANGAGDQSLGFYNGQVTNSLRVNAGDSMTRAFGTSPTSSTTMSFGGWCKFTGQHYMNLFSATLGGSGVPQSFITINDDLKILLQSWTGSANIFHYISTRVIRDTSAWMHLWVQIDTTDGTASDRVKLYVNGVRETVFDTAVNPSSGVTVVGFNQNYTHYFGHTNASYGIGAYIADWWFLDGQDVSPVDTVGEFKNGVFIPKEYSSPTFGNKGFHLEFKQTGTGTASTSTIGADTSGNNNHWTSSGIVASDCNMPDSPENNFCTLNNNARGTTNVALSDGALKFVCNTGNTFGNVLGTIPLFSGKWYCEGYMANTSLTQFGVQEVTNNIWLSSGDFGANTDLGMWDSRGYFYDEGTAGGTPSSFANGDIINIAFDVDAGKIWFGKNGTYLFSGDPANGTNQSTGSTNDLSPIGVTIAGNGASGSGIFNCGQDDTFAGNKTSGSANATDSEGIGQFYYSPPSGFLAICTANLPEPTISPNSATQAVNHFGTLTYTGDNNARSIRSGAAGIGGKIDFKPDWLWTKSRSDAESHRLHDSSRGDNGTVMYELNSDTTEVEGTDTLVTGFDDLGFNIASGGNTPNVSSRTYVAWNWKANGGTKTSFSESGDNPAGTHQANQTAGFSIVTTTGTGDSGATIAHGLGAIPKMIIAKRRTPANGWAVYHHGMGTGSEMYLNLDQVKTNSNFWITDPTTSVFSVSSSDYVNKLNETYVFYCFAEIEGYSKIGSFIGNGLDEGPFVYTGFKPSFVMSKSEAGSADWHIMDVTRNPTNVMDGFLFPSGSFAEASDAAYNRDFSSNGFKIRGSEAYVNASGVNFIYMAFAENPFKYANAR